MNKTISSSEIPQKCQGFTWLLEKYAFFFKNENNFTNCTFSASARHYLLSPTEERWKVIQTANIQLNARFFSLSSS